MLTEISSFVNWTRRRNPAARTWRDYAYDLRQAQLGHLPSTINRRLAASPSRAWPQHKGNTIMATLLAQPRG